MSRSPNPKAFIREDHPNLVRFHRLQAVTPCRAERVVKDHWWVTDSKGYLVFLGSPSGSIPQCSNDALTSHLMKRVLFPWCALVKLREVYLVRDKTKGWKVPYGRVN